MTEFDQVLKEMGELHHKKQSDYGRTHDPYANVRASEDFGIAGWIGCAIRMNDKMRRIQKFASTGELANESIEDAFLDLAVYAIIGLCLYRETTGTEIRASGDSDTLPVNECASHKEAQIAYLDFWGTLQDLASLGYRRTASCAECGELLQSWSDLPTAPTAEPN